MLKIACPWCGPRDEVEFQCGGELVPNRPTPPEAVTTQQWAAYVFYRDNVKGRHRERWLHRHGCGQWFAVTRDTATHEITETAPFGAPV